MLKTKPQKNDYLQRLLESKDEHVKQPQRELVLEFMSTFCPSGNSFKFLTLPGVHWRFEGMCEEVFDDCYFVGIERNTPLFEATVEKMPGDKKRYYRYKAKAWNSVLAATSGYYEIVKSRLSDFVTQWGSNAPFTSRYRNFNMVWLDTCNNLGSTESQVTLRNLHRCLDQGCAKIPLAITMMVGREQTVKFNKAGSSALAREHYIIKLLGNNDYWQYEPVDCWTYKSANNSTMGCWTGLMIRT